MYLKFSLFFLLISGIASGQFMADKHYPASYFINPLHIPMRLAANFGELRANHYHMGLDIRTAQRENLPVYAAAAGYIAKVKIEPFGFGQAIYINHPNGYTTLYAHLNDFYPVLADYIKQKQYELESWDAFIILPPGLFPVKQGDLIAFSGNRGGSQGPHLHFEIRRTNDDTNLNPMLFGFPIPDNIPPVIRKLALYDRTQSIYEQSPLQYPVQKAGASYAIAAPVLFSSTGQLGFGIAAFDTQSGSVNPNGIYQAVAYDNGKAIGGFQMDNISYDDTRDINAHIDYKTQAAGGASFQLLFELPGYTHSIYMKGSEAGSVDISDGEIHQIRIVLKDAYGNAADLNFKVQYRPAAEKHALYAGKTFYPFMLDGYEAEDCAFYLGEKSLYDSVHIKYNVSAPKAPDAVSRLHSIGTIQVPLREAMLVRIKSSLVLNAADKDRVVMQRMDKKGMEVRKVSWDNDWASTRFREFGDFQLLLDTIAPVIRFEKVMENADLAKASRLLIYVTDNLKTVKHFRAMLDGHWLLFTNDKERAFIYIFDDHCQPGNHELQITAEDEAGNKASKTLHFRR